MSLIDQKVKKVLEAKFKLGFSNYKPIELFNLNDDLNSNSALSLKRTLIENSLTLLRNQSNKLPLEKIDDIKIVSIAIGVNTSQIFQNTVNKYINSTFFGFTENDSEEKKQKIISQCRKKDYVIISLHKLNNNSKLRYGLSTNELDLINDVSKVSKVILVNFGTPYILKYFDHIQHIIQTF